MQFAWILVCVFCFTILGCSNDQGGTAKLPAGEEAAPDLQAGQEAAPTLETGQEPATFDTAPEPIHRVTPVYPEDARAAGLKGTTQIAVSIDASGKVVATRVILSSGSANLDNAAEDAGRQWTFKPAMLKGQPVPSEVVLPIRFELH